MMCCCHSNRNKNVLIIVLHFMIMQLQQRESSKKPKVFEALSKRTNTGLYSLHYSFIQIFTLVIDIILLHVASEQELPRKVPNHKLATVHPQVTKPPPTSKPINPSKNQMSMHARSSRLSQRVFEGEEDEVEEGELEVPVAVPHPQDALPARKRSSTATINTVNMLDEAEDMLSESGSIQQDSNTEECEIVDVICSNYTGDGVDSDTGSELSAMAEEIVSEVLGEYSLDKRTGRGSAGSAGVESSKQQKAVGRLGISIRVGKSL